MLRIRVMEASKRRTFHRWPRNTPQPRPHPCYISLSHFLPIEFQANMALDHKLIEVTNYLFLQRVHIFFYRTIEMNRYE